MLRCSTLGKPPDVAVPIDPADFCGASRRSAGTHRLASASVRWQARHRRYARYRHGPFVALIMRAICETSRPSSCRFSPAGRFWGNIAIDACRTLNGDGHLSRPTCLEPLSELVGIVDLREQNTALVATKRRALPRGERDRAGRDHHDRYDRPRPILESGGRADARLYGG